MYGVVESTMPAPLNAAFETGIPAGVQAVLDAVAHPAGLVSAIVVFTLAVLGLVVVGLLVLGVVAVAGRCRSRRCAASQILDRVLRTLEILVRGHPGHAA